MRDVVELAGKKVLLIKLRYIGDTLSMIPVVSCLREKVPQAMVDVMVHKGTEEVLTYHPDIRKVWIYDRGRAKNGLFSSLSYHWDLIKRLRVERYDVIVDFSHGDRAAFLAFMTGAPHRITYKDASALSHLLMNQVIQADPAIHHIVDYQVESLRYLGLDHFKKEFRLYIPDSIHGSVDHLLSGSHTSHPSLKIAIHPGAGSRFRRWRTERFAEIARLLKGTYGAEILLVGGPGEAHLVDQMEREMGFTAFFKTTGLSLLEMGSLFQRCRLFLGNDSAPGHIAAAVDCPSLVLFGPTFPHMWRPYSPAGQVLFKNLPCCGCRQESCVRPEMTCMDLIGVEEVWEVIQKMLQNPPRPLKKD